MPTGDANQANDTPGLAGVPAHSAAGSLPLATVATRESLQGVRSRLQAASRRGRIPGFRGSADQAVAFVIEDLGSPFSAKMTATYEAGVPEATLRFATRLNPLGPAVFGTALVLAVWPGLPLTHSMLSAYFDWYRNIETWWWYLPLSVPFLPLAMLSALRKSRASAHEDAAKVIEKIAVELAPPLPSAH